MPVKIEGIDALMERLDDVADVSEVRTAVGKACAIVEASAIQKAPKDTGALRRSIQSKVYHGGGEITGVIFTPLEYAPYVEFGTGIHSEKGGRSDVPWTYKDDDGTYYSTYGQHPQPFLRPAFKENRQKILKIIKEGMK